MGLSVGRIMGEVEHELRHMDDELSDKVDVNMGGGGGGRRREGLMLTHIRIG